MVDTLKNKKKGRPLKYFTPQELLTKVLEYLSTCEKNREMPNRAGLCVFLEISRETYYEWKKNKKKNFSDTIKRFEESSENRWVQRLGGNSPTGAIFYLKNAFREDYKDRQELDQSGRIDIKINYGQK